MSTPTHGLEHRSLRKNLDFVIFLTGQTVSVVGSVVTQIALPLTAIVTLHAGAIQMGALGAAGSIAPLLFGLPVGVWADRLPRRPMMIVANLSRALLLASIPIAAWRGVLQLPQLYIVSFLVASLGVFFNTARQAYLPSIVSPEHLVKANSAMRAGSSTAGIAGPGLAGVLVQVLSPPIAIAVDALSFLVSASSISLIRARETRSQRERASMGTEMGEGIRLILGNPVLRTIVATSATFNLFDSVLFAVYILYMARTLQLTASSIGAVFAVAGAGGLVAALLTSRITARLGLGRAIFWGIALAAVGELLIAGAQGPQFVALLLLIVAEGAVELGATLYGINAGSVQQVVVPDSLRGRVSGTSDMVTLGVGPIGALLGGVLGQTIGLRQTVLIAGIGTLLALGWLLFSPVTRLREIPSAP